MSCRLPRLRRPALRVWRRFCRDDRRQVRKQCRSQCSPLTIAPARRAATRPRAAAALSVWRFTALFAFFANLHVSPAGADGTVTLSANQGTSQSTTVTVTTQSALTVGETVSVKICWDAVAEVTSSETMSLTITNTQSTATTAQSSNQQTQTIAIDAKVSRIVST